MTEHVVRALAESRRVYGGRHVYAELTLRHGIAVRREAVSRLMRLARLQGLTGRPRYRHVSHAPTAEDRVGRQYRRNRPDESCVTDITGHASRGGKVYCAIVLDAYSRRVVGWSIDSFPTACVVTSALGMAIEERRPPTARTVGHSDQGTRFISWAFTRRAVESGLLPSMGSVGSCYDNAMIDSFWSGMRV